MASNAALVSASTVAFAPKASAAAAANFCELFADMEALVKLSITNCNFSLLMKMPPLPLPRMPSDSSVDENDLF